MAAYMDDPDSEDTEDLEEDESLEDEEEEFPDDRFFLDKQDIWLLNRIRPLGRRLLHREDLPPGDIHHLACLILALERMPFPTRGIDLMLGLKRQIGDSSLVINLGMGQGSFRLENGGYTRGPYGGDAFGGIALELELGGYHDRNSTQVTSWLYSFEEAVDSPSWSVEFESFGDETLIDWDDVGDPDEA